MGEVIGEAVAAFRQDVPRVGNQFLENSALRSVLRRVLPAAAEARVAADLEKFGWRVVRELPAWKRSVLRAPPALVQYDGWGRRVDEITIGDGWFRMHGAAAEEGLVALGYEPAPPGEARFRRVHQMAKTALFEPVAAMFTCPLAMTDGAALLLTSLLRAKQQPPPQNAEYLRALRARLLARDGASFWTSGQWMTERPGGSDVGHSETVARRDRAPGAPPDAYLLHGYKFFTSSTLSDVAFALARVEDPESGAVVPGSRGLSLFVVTLRDAAGRLDRIRVHKMKDKMGTVALPTAELELVGTPARMVGEPGRGVPTISTLFNVTRIWAANCSLGSFRKALAVARDYAHRRVAFGKPIADLPLHRSFLAGMEATYRGLLQFVVHVCLLQGTAEAAALPGGGDVDPADAARARALLRLLTPVLKMYVSKHAAAGVLECIEALGGVGFMNDATDLPDLFGNAFVNVIWEGTTNIMALDMLRALGRSGEALRLFLADVRAWTRAAESVEPAAAAYLLQCAHELEQLFAARTDVSGSARDVAFAMAALYCGALLCAQLAWARAQPDGGGAEADAEALRLWIERHVRARFPIELTRAEPVAALGLDTDPRTRVPRGCGNVCPETGQMRASY